MITRTTSRPTPSGFQHSIEIRLRRAPAFRYTDSIRALTDIKDGLTQPLVEVVEEQPSGGVVVRASVFSETPGPSPSECAALEGIRAELVFDDVGSA